MQQQKVIKDVSKLQWATQYEKRNLIPIEYIQDENNQIVCKLIHENEIFISSNGRVWPCCFLWDEYLRYSEFYDMTNINWGIIWNDLNNYNLETILNHIYYTRILELSWKLRNQFHTARCWLSCAKKGKLRNFIKQLN